MQIRHRPIPLHTQRPVLLPDILLESVQVLDLQKIAPSTSTLAQLTQGDQSSILPLFRQVSGA